VARARLAQLPCPSVALAAPGLAPEAATLIDRFDVAVDSEAELATVVAAIERTPLAAMALVQLLRHDQALDAHQALVAESFVYATLQGGPEHEAWLARRRRPARPAPSREPAVLASRSEGRLELTLNRPERRNAFSAAMRDALVEGLALAIADPSIAEIVLGGRGPAFCSGGDLDEFGTFPDPATAHAVRSTRHPARLLAACGDRVRAEIHGACVGAGIELAAFARRVIARPDAFFQLPEVGMGLVPGAGGTVSIPRRVGRQRAAYLCLTGLRLDAATALRWGLIDEVAA
jgi:enoyl-CoA hydratase